MLNDLIIRPAVTADIVAIRDLLADDELGKSREDLSAAGLTRYIEAFEKISTDANNTVYVAIHDARIVGCYQLTFIPYLSRGGNMRALVEAVRVATELRRAGVGTKLMQHAIITARQKGSTLVQLTSDKTRSDAHRFYTRLGFTASHEGFKLML